MLLFTMKFLAASIEKMASHLVHAFIELLWWFEDCEKVGREGGEYGAD